ncbi:MAG TPA: hypothetical protein PLP39_06300 [Flavobacterium lutivivi]|nr:hypothetical protein [Flavobacterium lutivivi]
MRLRTKEEQPITWFAKSGARVQAPTFGILLNNILNLNICISKFPPSTSLKTVADI